MGAWDSHRATRHFSTLGLDVPHHVSSLLSFGILSYPPKGLQGLEGFSILYKPPGTKNVHQTSVADVALAPQGLRKLRSPSLPACPSSPCPPVQPILLRTGRAPGDGGRHVRHARSPAVFGCQSNVSIKKGTCGTWKIEKSDIKRLQVCLFFPSPVYLCTRLPFSISEKEVGWL